MRISIIEDDQLISQMYRMKLESEGYDVDIADNGMNGIEMASQRLRQDDTGHRPDQYG